METVLQQNPETFVDRRGGGTTERPLGVPERRQFRSTPTCSRPEVQELANAVDQYKLNRHRRFITYEELYGVIEELGYRKI
ncbi:hypothetical protein GC163_18755 [bacterium]|nr:hypothetical protein [bacterium]